MRSSRLSLLLCAGLAGLSAFGIPARAQTTSATVTGQVTDQQGKAIPGVAVVYTNLNTGVLYTTKTNNDGIYTLSALQPGIYRANITKDGFKSLVKSDIQFQVQANVSINFSLQLGSVSETVTVRGGAPLVNTTNGSVSTVVDRNFVKNMPLNGESFQSLILLTPGVVNTSTQGYLHGALTGFTGEFDVNGQHSDANYYTVDGVSANVSTYRYAYGTTGTSGSLPAESALGTTQNLVPLDDLQEFRIDTSGYSAQSGTMPGAQFIFATRSGTNQWHGDAYDYLRNTAFDANNWFNDYHGLTNPGERQNDFGGSLGGPVEIPHVYHGKNKTFFFFSYEGVRLGQPLAATITNVPDNALRASAPAALQPILDAFPIPNGPETGTGLAEFIGTGTAPSSLDSANIRLDEDLSPKLHMFFRFANTSSTGGALGPNDGNGDAFSVLGTLIENTRSYTFGSDSAFSSTWSNEFRFNYTHNRGGSETALRAFGRGVPVNMAAEIGVPDTSTFAADFLLLFPGVSPYASVSQTKFTSQLSGWNLVDTVGWTHGRHQLKFGVDYRETLPTITGEGNPFVIQEYRSEAHLLANIGDASEFIVNHTTYPVFVNSALFAQDDWQVAPRLTLNMGLDWNVDPAPGNHHHTAAYVVQNAGNVADASLAPYGTPLYDTTWFNFAPRLGVAYLLGSSPGHETVLRGGFGVFFDTGQQDIPGAEEYGIRQPGYSTEYITSYPWPFTPAEINSVTIPNPPTPPFNIFGVFPTHLQLPYTLEYNVSLQQALGNSQALTVSYVGSHAARLMGYSENYVGSVNRNFTYIDYITSGHTSDYNALQLQYQRRMSRGFQALASYTYSHCIDYSSSDFFNAIVPERADCDYDVRHNFSAALTYEPPSVQGNGFVRAVLNHWGFDDRFTARTGFPITLFGNFFINPATGQEMYGGLNTVSGQSAWLYGSQYPGGREINSNAFTPAPISMPGDATRNSLQAFGAWQMDLSIRRTFPIYERMNLQFRADAFNTFNHPSFGTIYPYYCHAGPGCQFGHVTSTLNNSLGALSPLYQMGGPRSLQLSLRLAF